MHPQRTTVWCGFWTGGVINLSFFEDDEGATVTVNGDCYRNMLSDCGFPQFWKITIFGFNKMVRHGLHSAKQSLCWMKNYLKKLSHCVITRNGLPDLMPCDFFCRDLLNQKCTWTKPKQYRNWRMKLQGSLTHPIISLWTRHHELQWTNYPMPRGLEWSYVRYNFSCINVSSYLLCL